MLKRWRWFLLLGESSVEALTVGRVAGRWGGSQGSASLRSEGSIAFTPKPQPNYLFVQRTASGCDEHKSCKGKNFIFLPLLCLVGKASAHVRMVSILHSLGNERQSTDSVSSLTWWKIQCTRECHLRACTERERPTNTWIWWERLKSPVPQCEESITNHKSLERENKRRRKYSLWMERRKEEMTKESHWWLSWETEERHEIKMIFYDT